MWRVSSSQKTALRARFDQACWIPSSTAVTGRPAALFICCFRGTFMHPMRTRPLSRDSAHPPGTAGAHKNGGDKG